MKRIKTAFAKIKQIGLLGFVIFFIEGKIKINLPISAKLRWNYSKISEIEFWDMYFKSKGLQWADGYHVRFDPSLQLQDDVIALLPQNKSQVNILDVGSGPLTYLGKTYKNLNLKITAVDPLADDYNKILQKYNISPIIRTKKMAAEELSKMLPLDSFDIVFARNCIDHSYSPEKAILEMLKVVKKNHYILMIHRPNEAITEHYMGLHQWNFSSVNEDFIISSKKKILNFSQFYGHLCKISCSYDDGKDGKWLKTVIQKL